MPCNVSDAEIEHFEREANQKRYGEPKLNREITTYVACETIRLLRETGNFDRLSKTAQLWWENHEREDAARAAMTGKRR